MPYVYKALHNWTGAFQTNWNDSKNSGLHKVFANLNKSYTRFKLFSLSIGVIVIKLFVDAERRPLLFFDVLEF